MKRRQQNVLNESDSEDEKRKEKIEKAKKKIGSLLEQRKELKKRNDAAKV